MNTTDAATSEGTDRIPTPESDIDELDMCEDDDQKTNATDEDMESGPRNTETVSLPSPFHQRYKTGYDVSWAFLYLLTQSPFEDSEQLAKITIQVTSSALNTGVDMSGLAAQLQVDVLRIKASV